MDTRSDLFSLGSVMYAMSTGRPPFRAETSYGILRRVTDQQPRSISELNSEIPAWLQGFIEKLLAKLPGDRFDSAANVAQMLEECVAHVQQPSANALPVAVKALRDKSSWPRLVLAASVALLSLLLLISGDWFGISQPNEPQEKTATEIAAKTSPENAPPDESASSLNDSTLEWHDNISDSLETLGRETELLMQQLNSEL